MVQNARILHESTDCHVSEAPAVPAVRPLNEAVSPVHLVDVGAGLFGLDGQWPDLVRQVGGGPFFLGPEWLDAWWKTYGQTRAPLILRVDDGASPVAVVPLCISRRRLNALPVREVGWVGAGERACPEHMDALGDSATPAAAAIGDWLQRNRGEWDVIRLLDSRPGGFAGALAQRMGEAGFVTQTLPDSRCPGILLPASYEELVAGYSYNMRRTVRRIAKRLNNAGGYRVEWFDQADDQSEQAIQHAIDEMNRLHTLARSAHSESGNFSDEGYRAFHARLIANARDSGRLRLAFLYHGESARPVAFRYGFLQQDVWLDYQTGYDIHYRKQRIGWYLLGECLQRAIREGAAEFDMLRGDHDYKLHWATNYRHTETVWIFNNSLRGYLARSMLRGKQIIKSARKRFVRPRVDQE